MPSIPKSALFFGIIGLVVLSNCGTPEYRVERQHCEAEWMLKIPPVYRKEIVTKHRNEERLTGQTHCETVGTITNCTQLTKTVSVPYQVLETVDIRKRQRDPQIASCTARACMRQYGNSECKI